ncbi:MAG TPA: phosphoglucosamine mutase, partial [bacterium]|nr:phosphoglucosamine mutase [bacterium]
LGGEPSGHIIFLHHTTSGDGTLAAMRVLSVMCQRGLSLSEVRRAFKPFPQVNLDVKVKEKRPFEGMPAVAAAMADAESALGSRGRILVRYSGTENIARIMLEGEEIALIERLASEIASEIRAELGS